MTRNEIITQMNELGCKNSPFFFILGYNEKLNILSQNPFHDKRFTFCFSNECEMENTLPFPSRYYIKKKPISLNSYRIGFEVVMSNILLGNSYLVNYTCSTPVQTNMSLDDLFCYSKAPYKLLLKNKFVVFSPERFIKISNGQISTNPMKGTIDAAVPNAEEVILLDKKEAAEHATIVDLLRNDLSRVANRVSVKRYRYTERIKTNEKILVQVSSEISGTLPFNYNQNIGTIIAQMLPAGSVTGAPKDMTQRIISESEGHSRGYYTGVFGYFDGLNLDSAVAIRYIEKTPHGLMFKSGGGITANSILEKEYQEMIDKVYVPIV